MSRKHSPASQPAISAYACAATKRYPKSAWRRFLGLPIVLVVKRSSTAGARWANSRTTATSFSQPRRPVHFLVHTLFFRSLASRRRLVIEQRPSTLNAVPHHSRRESRSIFAAAHEHWVDAPI